MPLKLWGGLPAHCCPSLGRVPGGLGVSESLLEGNSVVRDRSEPPTRLYQAFASGLGNLKERFFLWGLVSSIPAWREGRLSVPVRMVY